MLLLNERLLLLLLLFISLSTQSGNFWIQSRIKSAEKLVQLNFGRRPILPEHTNGCTYYLLTYLLNYLFTYLLTYLLNYLLNYLFTYLLNYLFTYLLNYLLTYLITYLLT
jgi:hypothetical protein